MKTITVTFSDGSSDSLPRGIHAAELLARMGADPKNTAAVLVNNELCSLNSRLEVNCILKPVGLDSAAGAMVLRRSLCFLLAIAARELFPERSLEVGHSLGSGYYYTFGDEAPVGADEIERIAARMRGIVAEDQAIRHELISYEDALHYFEKSGQADTLLLLRQMNDPRIPVNTCRGFMDLSIAPLLPSTGLMRRFELMPYEQGFLLRYPPAGRPLEMSAIRDNPLLCSIYKEYKRWGRTLGVTSVGAINSINKPGRIKAFIQTAEALHNKKIAEIADGIHERGGVKAVLVAGPSSSGKTTFSKKLAIQLTVLGMVPVPISLDDYFLDRKNTPRGADGQPDFECLEALDVELLNEQLLGLTAGEEVLLPVYDFKAGARSKEGRRLRLSGNEILIIEGIHGLNDRLTHRIPRQQKYKIYVSALTQLNLDDHNRIATTDNRLIRRIVRDYQFRGHSAAQTLAMWPSVQRGEKLHIFPFQNGADAAFNSALDYELAVLAIYAEPLLKEVKPFDPEYAEAARILSFLEYFSPIPPSHVPRDSILREFIGESEFKY
jgi:uridine kinase